MNFSTTKSLYEELPFPLRDPSDENLRLITPPPDHLGKINHFCFRGLKNFDDSSRLLVAGGGTGDAAIFLAEQLSYRGGGNVVYVDQSESSMEIAKARAEARGLRNIDWINGSILSNAVDSIGQFDYINCVGVIHHLEQPIDGLLKLKSLLKADGAMCLMVYGRYGRQDITSVREIFQLYKKVSKPGNILDDAKKLLSSLAPTNSYMRGRQRSYILSQLFSDLPNLADIFLNPVEWVYSCEELANLVEDEARLVINKFTTYDCDPAIMGLQYDPSLLVSDNSIRVNLKNLDKCERWKMAEILDGSMHLHCMYIQRKKTDPADFTDNNLIPFFESQQAKQAVFLLIRQKNQPLNIKLSNGSEFPLSICAKTAQFLELINNEDNIKEILSLMSISKEEAAILLNELRLLAELEWVLLRAPSVQPFLKLDSGESLTEGFNKNGMINYSFPGLHKDSKR